MTSPNVRKFLNLSTCHVSFATSVKFGFGLGNAQSTEYGWLLYVRHDDEMVPKDWPADLKAVNAKARELACDYVLFDRDASEMDSLSTFYW